jgi:hypothetical protein
MLATLLTLGLSQTNYGILNKNNVYNFILSVMDKIKDDENNGTKKQILIDIKIYIGLSFHNSFLNYVRKKDADNVILKL